MNDIHKYRLIACRSRGKNFKATTEVFDLDGDRWHVYSTEKGMVSLVSS